MYYHMPAKSYQYFTATVLFLWHVLANGSTYRTSKRTSKHPQLNVLQSVLQMHLTISRNYRGARPKFHWFQSSSTKLPTPIASLQSIPLPLLDLIEDTEAMVLRCCTLWWLHVGVDGLFPGRDQLADISCCQGGHSGFLSIRWSWPSWHSHQRQWTGISTTSHFWTLQLVNGMFYSLLRVSIQLLSRSQITWM